MGKCSPECFGFYLGPFGQCVCFYVCSQHCITYIGSFFSFLLEFLVHKLVFPYIFTSLYMRKFFPEFLVFVFSITWHWLCLRLLLSLCVCFFWYVFLSTILFESILASPSYICMFQFCIIFLFFTVIFFLCFVYGIWPALVCVSFIEHFTTLLQLALQFSLSSMASHHVSCWLTNFPYDVKVFWYLIFKFPFHLFFLTLGSDKTYLDSRSSSLSIIASSHLDGWINSLALCFFFPASCRYQPIVHINTWVHY